MTVQQRFLWSSQVSLGKQTRLFNSVPSCLYTDHGIPCELRLSTLTWKAEWHNSVLFGHQSQRALSPFLWRGKGLLLNPYLSAHNSKWRKNSQYYVSHPRLIDLVECNEQNACNIVRKGDKKGRKHGSRFCTTRQAGVIHDHLRGPLEFQMLDLVLTHWTPSTNSYVIMLMRKSGITGKLVTLWQSPLVSQHIISFSRCFLQGLHSTLERLQHNQEKSFHHIFRLPLDQSSPCYRKDANIRARWHLSY